MNHDQLADQLYPQAGTIPADYDLIMDRYDRELLADQGQLLAVVPELAAFNAVTDAQYTEAKMIIRGMAAKDRAVLTFWARELIGVADAVDLDEVRY